MILQVESLSGQFGDREPSAFMLGGARIEVLEIVDRWIAAQHSYYKVQASDAATYILRYTVARNEWQLTLYQAPRERY